MAASYPTGFDSMSDPGSTLSGAPTHSSMHNQINDVAEAIEVELGLNPSGASATVAARFTADETQIAKNYTVCTSGTHPGAPTEGDQIYETDTDMEKIYDGSAWRTFGVRRADASVATAFAPAGNNDATTTGAYTDWVQLGASSSLVVPAWAAKAVFSLTANYVNFVTAGLNVYVNRLLIGSDASPTGHPVIDPSARFGFTFHDTITLTSTGAKTLKIQNLRSAGTGQWRADVSTTFSWRIDFIPA